MIASTFIVCFPLADVFVVLWLFLTIAELCPVAQADAACGLTAGASLLNASLERCLQRCRDSMGGCQRIGYDSNRSQCAIGVGTADCGAGWELQSLTSLDSTCNYGRGIQTGMTVCSTCEAGSASHAQVGDLEGLWSLTLDGAAAGHVEVTGGGVARYSTGIAGQFVLYHARSDPKYPGAFFLSHASGDWDYAWLEDHDNVTDGPLLTVRRFRTAVQKIAPEGSPHYWQTLLGKLTTVGEVPCAALDATVERTGTASFGSCCNAVEQVNGREASNKTANFNIGFQIWKDAELVEATWNSAMSLSALKALQGAKLVMHGSDEQDQEVCSSVGSGLFNNAVVLVKRGTCELALKAILAQEAGALAVIIVNNPGDKLPPYIIRDKTPKDPDIPTWMLGSQVGQEMLKALKASASSIGVVTALGLQTSAQSSAILDLCCQDSCRTRVLTAAGQGLSVPDVVGTCARVDCAAYVIPGSTPLQLPHAGYICGTCGSGLASVVEGRANCAPCGDGTTPNQGGSNCEACPAGRAGTLGLCAACPTGRTASANRDQCIEGSSVPGPVAPGPTVAPGLTAAPAAATAAPSPPSTSPKFVFAGDGDTGGEGGDGQEEDAGIPWGTIIGIICALVGGCGLVWTCSKIYARHADRLNEAGPGLGGLAAAVFGNSGGGGNSGENRRSDDDDDDEEAATSKKKKKSSEEGGEAKPKDSTGEAKKSGAGSAPAEVKLDKEKNESKAGAGGGGKEAKKDSGGTKEGGAGGGAEKKEKTGGGESGEAGEGTNGKKGKGGVKSVEYGGIRINFK